MQKKIEDINYIQSSLWGLYKNFLTDHDPEKYKELAVGVVSSTGLQYFCDGLVHTWISVIDKLAEDFKSGVDARSRLEGIKHIQNKSWSIYKGFLSDHDMWVYNCRLKELRKEYLDKGDKFLFEFCVNIIFAWAPVINSFAEDFGIQ